MHKLGWLVAACCLTAAPALSHAQQKDDPESFVRDVLNPIFGPNWNLFAQGGLTTTGRFLMQTPGVAGQRVLWTNTGWNAGGGAGVDILVHTGFRIAYSYASSNLKFDTDNGDGSHTLDVSDFGKINSHFVSAEVIRYMLPSHSAFTPYGSIGLAASWWQLSDNTTLVDEGSGGSEFRYGPLAAFGLQARLGAGFFTRLEWVKASVGNPFTGRDSFRAFGGAPLEEPSGVGKADWRLAVVYNFAKITK